MTLSWEKAVTTQLSEVTLETISLAWEGIDMAENGEVTLKVTGEAAAINHVADVCGEIEQSKGFREEWEDADYLDNLADQLESDGGTFSLIDRAPRVREIAEKHRRLANVQKLMLMVSEASEALSDLRDGKPYGEELADLMIRVMSNAQQNRIPIGDEIIKKVEKNMQREFRHGREF